MDLEIDKISQCQNILNWQKLWCQIVWSTSNLSKLYNKVLFPAKIVQKKMSETFKCFKSFPNGSGNWPIQSEAQTFKGFSDQSENWVGF